MHECRYILSRGVATTLHSYLLYMFCPSLSTLISNFCRHLCQLPLLSRACSRMKVLWRRLRTARRPPPISPTWPHLLMHSGQPHQLPSRGDSFTAMPQPTSPTASSMPPSMPMAPLAQPAWCAPGLHIFQATSSDGKGCWTGMNKTARSARPLFGGHRHF